MYSNVEKKNTQKIQNIQSKSVRLENILARKYWCVSNKVMTEKGGKIYLCENMKNLLKLFLDIHVFMIKPKRSIRTKCDIVKHELRVASCELRVTS